MCKTDEAELKEERPHSGQTSKDDVVTRFQCDLLCHTRHLTKGPPRPTLCGKSVFLAGIGYLASTQIPEKVLSTSPGLNLENLSLNS